MICLVCVEIVDARTVSVVNRKVAGRRVAYYLSFMSHVFIEVACDLQRARRVDSAYVNT